MFVRAPVCVCVLCVFFVAREEAKCENNSNNFGEFFQLDLSSINLCLMNASDNVLCASLPNRHTDTHHAHEHIFGRLVQFGGILFAACVTCVYILYMCVCVPLCYVCRAE